MQNTYYKHPNITITKEEIEKALGLSKFHFLTRSGRRLFDDFKSKLDAKDIPEDCVNLIKLRDSNFMHPTITMIVYDDQKLTEDISKYYSKNENGYTVGIHKDGNNQMEGFDLYAGSLVFPLFNAGGSTVDWYADHPEQKVYNIRTGTWCENYDILQPTDSVTMEDNVPLIIRTDAWHGVKFETAPRVIMRWLFRHDLTWDEIYQLFD